MPADRESIATLVESVSALSEHVNNLTAKVDITDRMNKRQKRLEQVWRTSWMAAVSFTILIIMFAGFLVYQLANDRREANEARALQNRRHIIKLCEGLNEIRDGERALWEPVLANADRLRPPGETPEQIAVRQEINRKFQEVLQTNFAHQDCPDETSK